MKSENWFILLIVGFTLLLSSTCTADRASFGDNCNKTNRCDAQSTLSCIENKCQCVKPSEMIFDEIAKKCRILSGEKCSFTLVESLTDIFEERRVTEIFDCVENAICSAEYCSCEPNYYEDTQGICRPKGLDSEHCVNDDVCRSDLQLKCNNGLCSCNQTESAFNGGRCVAKVGFSCMKYGLACVNNAECGYYDKMCTCRNGYEKSDDGFCLGQYGMSCDSSISPCQQQWSCFDSQCSCHFPQHQSFDSRNGQCVSYVEGPCSENVNGSVQQFQCVENAECKTHDDISECICRDGYINSYDRRCYLAHGQPCVASKSCDPWSKLVCKNGKCACHDLHLYDEERSICLGLVGAECNMKHDFCHDGSSCQSNRFKNIRDWSFLVEGFPPRGTCRCSESYVSNYDRKCVQELVVQRIEVRKGAEDEEIIIEI